ncbi:hypothetical protein [Corallococcus sp. M7]
MPIRQGPNTGVVVGRGATARERHARNGPLKHDSTPRITGSMF